METEKPWYKNSLKEGIDSIEEIKEEGEGFETTITVSFKTDKATLSDLLEVMGRLGSINFFEQDIIPREGKGPEIVFVPGN